MTTVFLFPGQGAQRKGMGAELFGSFPKLVRRVDDELGYSIRELCVDDPQKGLAQTQYTQVALYVVNALLYYARIRASGTGPDVAAGHSLGEYNALLAAEVFDFVTGLKLVKKRGELMARAKPGGMAAVLGIEPSAIERRLVERGLESIDIANYNSPEQTVIAGPKEDVQLAVSALAGMGGRVVPLRVGGAFHSRYMREAAQEYAGFLDSFEFRPPRCVVLSNVTGRPYRGDDVKENLVAQIDHSVRWLECTRTLLAYDSPEFDELGPSSVLLELIKQTRN